MATHTRTAQWQSSRTHLRNGQKRKTLRKTATQMRMKLSLISVCGFCKGLQKLCSSHSLYPLCTICAQVVHDRKCSFGEEDLKRALGIPKPAAATALTEALLKLSCTKGLSKVTASSCSSSLFSTTPRIALVGVWH